MNIYNLERSDLAKLALPLPTPPIHGQNIFRDLYKHDFSLSMDPLIHRHIGQYLANIIDKLDRSLPQICSTVHSNYDGSVKFLLSFSDHKQVEMVLMPEKKRITLCVSSQVGCAQGCSFCFTGRMGLLRQLNTHEIIGQIVLANQWIRNNPSWIEKQRLALFSLVSNVVFMGMGEPLDNLDNITKAIKIMHDPYGLGLPMRKITVSTAGLTQGIKRLYQLLPEVRLALSLHSPFNSERSRIMPINKQNPLEEIIATIKEIQKTYTQEVFVQYTLLAGVNDTLNHAQALGELLKEINVKINLIPLNPIEPTKFRAPDHVTTQEFRRLLTQMGYRVLVRYSKGQDIQAACGQLVKTQAPTGLDL